MTTVLVRKRKENKYVCTHCGAGFMRETAYIEHVCLQMQRSQKMKTADGVSAWVAYTIWLKAKGLKVPPQTSFLTSKFYQSFIKFAEFVRQVKTINVEQYVINMVKHGIPPVIWTHDSIYSEWIRSTTEEKSPIKQVQNTAMFLMQYAEEQGFDISELFKHVTLPLFVHWLESRQISMWFMLGSKCFKQWQAALDGEDREYLSTKFSVEEWLQKVRNNPNTMEKIKAIVHEMGL